ncbi:peptidylprolyl isomerase [Jeongeupia naejangsanensis]|uniref:Peptidylprolyl isomerase n=1 Tax=Jeongeupia naejangsanensis TaxID=613195 RepID=A0ABS2BL33_9NEIS|nr:peptidylprolyl isomerase [Jeongeupia naejangsanensis]MBM3116155.1 peptidylprolyl isomerase [Jeongeupia naejangsanensis]
MKLQLISMALATAAATGNAAGAVNVVCQTTKGAIDIVIRPEWSPKGAERFLQLVDAGHFNRVPFFRCLDGVLCQFGFPQSKAAAKKWSAIVDDMKQPALRQFKRGYISFAGAGTNSRTEHLFITLGEKVEHLGTQPWETPIGYVTPASMQQTVSRFNMSYGDIPPWGKGPDVQKLQGPGAAEYLNQNFPALDYIQSCKRR